LAGTSARSNAELNQVKLNAFFMSKFSIGVGILRLPKYTSMT